MWIQFQRGLKFGFHFPHELEGAERFGAGDLAQVHAQPVMRRGVGRIFFQDVAGGRDARVRDLGALGVLAGELRPIEGRAAEREVRGDIERLFARCLLRLREGAPGAGGEGVRVRGKTAAGQENERATNRVECC